MKRRLNSSARSEKNRKIKKREEKKIMIESALALTPRLSNSHIKLIYEAWSMNFSPKFTVRLREKPTDDNAKYHTFDFSKFTKLKNIPFFFLSVEIKNKGMMIDEKDRQNLYRDHFDDFLCLNYLQMLQYDTLETLFIERLLSLLIYRARLPVYCTNHETFVCYFLNVENSKYKFKSHSHQFCSSTKWTKRYLENYFSDDFVKPFYLNTCITTEIFQYDKQKIRSELCSRKKLLLIYNDIRANLYTEERLLNIDFMFTFIRNNIRKESTTQNELLLHRISNLINLFNFLLKQ